MFKLGFPPTSQEDINLAAKVAKVVELIDLRSTKGEFGPAEELAPKGSKKQDALAPYQFEISSRFDEKENRLEVHIVIQGRNIRTANGDGAGGAGLRVVGGFLLTYQLMVEPPPADLRSELFSAFARVNGLMNIWPYYREFAHEVARRVGFPGVIVPLLRVEPTVDTPKPGKITKKKPSASATKKAKG